MSLLAPSLAQKIYLNPSSPQNIILRINGDMETCEEMLVSQGIEIRRILHLINGFAITAAGSTVEQLANETWVMSIEEDQQVRTL